MEVKINREIRNYTESIFFGLSLRQSVFSLLAIIMAVILGFTFRGKVNTEVLSWICVFGAVPFGMLGFVTYHGMPAEQFAWAWLRSEILEPRHYYNEPRNTFYEVLKTTIEAKEKEEFERHDYDMELQRKEAKEVLDDLTTRDQRLMFAVITMLITADTKEQLDTLTESLRSIAQNRMCQMVPLTFQQLDGLATVLPIGPRKINAFRTLTTESLAVFMPFKVQEIQEKGGMYFGENTISHNLILCNKQNLQNQATLILGVPGSGKSFLTKEQIFMLIANTDDDIMICDPEGEYAPLVEAMGDLGTVLRIRAGGKDRLNAMYMVDGYGDSNPVVIKSEFIMSLIEQIDKEGVGPQHKSIIDRCVSALYREAREFNYTPTLSALRMKLMEQPEQQAKDIALALELYTTGSLDIFGHDSNVNLDKRVTVFDIHGLGPQLKSAGLLVITDTMLNRVTLNWKRGKRTHVFIDEFHVVFENEFSAAFFSSAWRQFRKRNAYPTAITQNVEYLLDSVEASTLVSNSELVVMLNQAASDREKLGNLLNISAEQMSYITNADAGCGLIKYGSSLVPFTNRFPRDTKLYELMTTTPGEGVFAKGRTS